MLSKPQHSVKLLSQFHFSSQESPFHLNELQQSLLGELPTFPSTPSLKSTKTRETFTTQNTKPFKLPTVSWAKDNQFLTASEALKEAARCLKCADAPCTKGCSASVDIKTFIYNIEKANWYGAAKTILSDNPMGLSCAQLCPVGELCAGNCNLKDTELGPVQINRLQEIAMKVFKEMGVAQERDPKITSNLPKSYEEKIALIGSGPASLTCATFLARLGYKNVHIFEKEQVIGGIPVQEIPENRVPVDGTNWEIQMVKQLGVKIFTGKKFGKDITEESLKAEGYKTFFLGVGFPESNQAIGQGKLKEIYNCKNVFTAKKFLKQIADSTKFSTESAVKLKGHVVVMGVGDTAVDCARSALRAGAERVSLVFRRGWDDMRAYHEEIELAIRDKCNFVPYCVLKDFECDGNNLKKLKYVSNFPSGSKYTKIEASNIEMSCDCLITAFGAQLGNENYLTKYAKDGVLNVDLETGQHKEMSDIFGGGDAIGSTKLVDAVNDGKNAAYFMHKHIQGKNGIKVGDFKLPGFYSAIDSVDLGMEFGGKKFENPFGLASAPPCTSYPMIKRAFEQGWGFAVVKTFTLDKDAVVNVSPRIYKATADEMKREAAFANIELISEKSAEYWIKGAQDIKKQFPNKVLVGSLMQGDNEEDWVKITRMANEAGFDLLELNLSCPHGMTEKGMGRACGESPTLVTKICSWVKKVANVPFFVKITPNYAYSEEIAKAALAGGAFGVTLTNTMPSLMDPSPDGIPWPAVSDAKKTAYGGSCGSVLRPYALKKASETAKAVPGIPIFGSGGIISCSNAMAFMRYGATALQVCSAVQNQDFATVIYDLITGVKAHLYLTEIEKLKKQGWCGQQPPNNVAELKNKGDLNRADNVKKIKEIIGSNLSHLSAISDMVNDTFVIPEFDQDKCLKCGRCYLTCADSGYQAIKLKGENGFPEVTDDCTGCGLCYAVCPVPGALNLIPRKTPYTPCRGIPLGPDGPKDVTVPPKGK